VIMKSRHFYISGVIICHNVRPLLKNDDKS
jgi:hypothetical protein